MARIVAGEIGRRIHLLVAGLARGDVVSLEAGARALVDQSPVDGAVRASVLLAMTSAATVYQQRLMPRDVNLVGVEVTLTACRADLVWRHASGQVAIDELKWSASKGRPNGQIRALVASGHSVWGSDFVGVRRCPLQRADRTALYTESAVLHRLSLPPWLEVR